MTLRLPGSKRNLFQDNTSSDEGYKQEIKEYVMGIHSSNFQARLDKDVRFTDDSVLIAEAAGAEIYAPLILPQGAVLLKAVVYGNGLAEARTWSLASRSIDQAGNTIIFNGNVNNSSSNPFIGSDIIIENENKQYFLHVNCVQLDRISGARIWYEV